MHTPSPNQYAVSDGIPLKLICDCGMIRPSVILRNTLFFVVFCIALAIPITINPQYGSYQDIGCTSFTLPTYNLFVAETVFALTTIFFALITFNLMIFFTENTVLQKISKSFAALSFLGFFVFTVIQIVVFRSDCLSNTTKNNVLLALLYYVCLLTVSIHFVIIDLTSD